MNSELKSDIDPEASNRDLAALSAQERVAWAIAHFSDRLVMSTSFGVQSAVLLHMVSRQSSDIPVVFIDTGYLFEETYLFAEALRERLKLNLKVYQPLMTAARQEALYGKLWEQGEDGLIQYGRINKVEPMNRAIKELNAKGWITGVRREQSSTRAGFQYIMRQQQTYKLNLISDWTAKDVHYYLEEHQLPYHPLWEKGYVSVGDWHSSSPLKPGQSEEQTRFSGIKRECGLHEVSGNSDWQI